MRPYLAILRDSFQEALSSRVLWMLLILTAMFLLALAPLGAYEKSRTTIESFDLTDGAGWLRALAAADSSAAPPRPSAA